MRSNSRPLYEPERFPFAAASCCGAPAASIKASVGASADEDNSGGSTELLECARKEARRLALRDVDTAGDLRLREVLVEPEPHELSLPRSQPGEHAADELALLARLD